MTLNKKNSAEFDFIGVVKDTKGKAVANVRDGITIKLPTEAASQLPKRSVLYDTGFTLTPGLYSIRFLVRENETGKMGTFERSSPSPTSRFSAPSYGEASCSRSRQRWEPPRSRRNGWRTILWCNPDRS